MSGLAFLAGAVLSILPVEGDPTRVVVTAVDTAPETTLTLHRLDEDGKVGGAIFGSLSRDDEGITFEPSFSLSRGEHYRAKLSAASGASVEADYFVPESEGVAPKLVKVFPGGEVVPSNLLKFYLHFDQPMREGHDIFDEISLIDEEGKTVNSPWRRQELWSDDAKRLILFIHPGRIKQGLQLRAEMGPVLEEGKRYTLTILGKVRGANGLPIGKAFSQSFQTSDPVRERIQPEKWDLQIPASGSDAPLVVTSDRALDPYLMERHCEIRGGEIDRVEWDKLQSVFQFFPKQAWTAGEYALEVSEYLEDLAGNTPVRVFDTDLEAEAGKEPVRKIAFTVE